MCPDDAVRVLQYYFSYICKIAGIHWNSDMDAEVADIIDYILSEPRSQYNKLLIYAAQLEDHIKVLDGKCRFYEVMLEQHADQFHRLVKHVDVIDQKLQNLNNKVNFPVLGDYKKE